MTRCPRCRGQLYPDQHREITCLQCGYVQPPLDPLPLIQAPRRGGRLKPETTP